MHPYYRMGLTIIWSKTPCILVSLHLELLEAAVSLSRQVTLRNCHSQEDSSPGRIEQIKALNFIALSSREDYYHDGL